ncbi:PP2C family protein-serine/threonine phosphatase [Leptodesmis sichuanensis]|uniref:PP2C family protein-serine/threonine phosphatase n=1 Tax=Leptodesmis sichuanensis TaxID=2906798 RepID=UPI001F37EAE4|nr:SpoIIE family protein phosphatase [Leptodesmis sichuanensis]UIE38800.1 SpoIIE family protein phosphatase [Leptodesmis sichuanensis A121]
MVRILVVEDDRTTQLVLRRMLEEQGYEVATANDGIEGMEQARTFRPALIICDWIMPRLDGLEVCRQVKADPDLSTIYFILLTARGAVEDRVQGLDSGADEFLAKPVELSELRARVGAGLRLNRVYQALQDQKRILESELTEAAEYVRSLLPPPLTGSVHIDSRFIPSRQLGGDCFDYYWLDPDYLAIYLLDVSGHGLGAALPSISVLNLLRSQSMDGVNFYQPNHVLRALNETFQMDDQNDKYLTIWYGVYNQARRQLIYSSAGHPPALLISKAPENGVVEVKQLKTVSLPIGMMPDTKFVNQRCDIGVGSTLYVFSDGVYEIIKPDGEIWGLEGLMDLVCSQQEVISVQGLNYILNYIKTLSPNEAFEDDVSLLRIDFS